MKHNSEWYIKDMDGFMDIHTDKGIFKTKYVINCAGQQSVNIAKDMINED